MDAGWVAGKVETSRRREGLSWTHHREVAGLEPKEQDRLNNYYLPEALERQTESLAAIGWAANGYC